MKTLLDGFVIGLILFIAIIWLIRILKEIKEREKIFPFWVDKYRITKGGSADLLSVDNKLIVNIPAGSEYILLSVPTKTIMGKAVKIIFIHKDMPRSIIGPYFIRYVIANRLKGIFDFYM